MSERERVAEIVRNHAIDFQSIPSGYNADGPEYIADAILAALRGDASGTADTSDGIVERLTAASHDDRLSTGMLYREAAAHIEALEAKVEEWKQLAELARASMEFTAKVHADAVAENARLREALAKVVDAWEAFELTPHYSAEGVHDIFIAARALLTDTEETT